MKKEKLSASFAKQLLNKPFKQIEYELKQPRLENDAMNQGLRWEEVLTLGNPNNLKVFSDTATKGVKFKAFKAEQTCEPYNVVIESEYLSTLEMLKNAPKEVMHIINNSKYQNYFNFESDGVPVHGYMDFVTDDFIYDMKVSDPTPKKFSAQVVNMGWDIQAYVYLKAYDFEKEFKWIAVSPTAPYIQRIYNCDQKYIDSGKEKFEKAKILFEQFNNGFEQPIEQTLFAPNWI